MNFIELGKDVFQNEIEGLNAARENLGKDFNESVIAIMESSARVVVTGMGKSGIVGKKIAATLASTGTRSFFIHPGEAYHGDLGMIHPNDVIIAISNSGETEEIIKLLSFFKENGNQVIGMTGKSESTLSKFSDFFLDISIPKEACPLQLAPTTSTTVSMAMGDALAVALMKARNFKPENFARFHPGGSLGRKLLGTVRDVVHFDNLPTVKVSDGFEKIVSGISTGRMGAVVVLGVDGELVGLITDGDIRRAIEKYKEKVVNQVAINICTESPLTILPSTKLIEAERLMSKNRVTNLVVIEDKNILGLVHLHDLQI